MNLEIFLKLFLAHILTDFVFQTDKWVKNKTELGLKSIYFWIHVFLSGATTYLLLQLWTNWQVPLIIIITHGIIDYWKIVAEKKNEQNKSKYFFIDQILHLLVLIVVWLLMVDNLKLITDFLSSLLNDNNHLIIITSFIFLIWPAGIAIGKFTEPFRREIETSDSLSNAGKYIGIFERILVLIFMMTGEYSAIGFLIASKSILRISTEKDDKARKKTEYVLIGTLMSFTITIIVGIIVNLVLEK